MEIYIYKDNFIKIFSVGVEKEYRGKSIVYENNTKTLVYYYMPSYRRLYIIDGKREDTHLLNIEEKVRVIGMLENREVNYFTKYLKEMIKSNKIFFMNDDFFIDIIIALKVKRPKKSEIIQIYNKNKWEREVYKNGL